MRQKRKERGRRERVEAEAAEAAQPGDAVATDSEAALATGEIDAVEVTGEVEVVAAVGETDAAADAVGETEAVADEVAEQVAEAVAEAAAEAEEQLEAEAADGEGGEDGEDGEQPLAPTELDDAKLKNLVEALVFASDKPMTVVRLKQLTRIKETARIEAALAALGEDYKERGIALQSISGGYMFRTQSSFSAWVQQLIAGRPVRLSRAQLETLAIIAYRQPITRPEIDDIRGVDSGGTLKVLLDRNLIRILGKKEEAGRPLLYGTTKEFLDFFSLGDLRELPTLREYSELSEEHRRKVDHELGEDPDDDADGDADADAPVAEAAPEPEAHADAEAEAVAEPVAHADAEVEAAATTEEASPADGEAAAGEADVVTAEADTATAESEAATGEPDASTSEVDASIAEANVAAAEADVTAVDDTTADTVDGGDPAPDRDESAA